MIKRKFLFSLLLICSVATSSTIYRINKSKTNKKLDENYQNDTLPNKKVVELITTISFIKKALSRKRKLLKELRKENHKSENSIKIEILENEIKILDFELKHIHKKWSREITKTKLIKVSNN